MRITSTRSIAMAAIAAISLGLLSPGTASASASTPKPYPAHRIPGLTTAAQMVEADGKLFVSPGPTGHSITVLSTNGAVIGHISGEDGADGMVASADGSTLYVALHSAVSGSISVISTSTLSETDRYTMSDNSIQSCPASVALANGRLFYSYGCSTSSIDGIASIDALSGGTSVSADLGSGYNDALLRGSGSTLAILGTSALDVYSAGADGSVSTALPPVLNLDPEPVDMAFTSDGQHLLTAAGSPYQITSYAAATMMPDSIAYAGVAYPTAVATDPTGSSVAGGFEDYGTTAMLYKQGDATPRWVRYTAGLDPTSWHTNVSLDTMLPQTMVFSADGSEVFGLVSRENLSGVYFFASTVSAPTPTSSAMTLSNIKTGHKDTAVVKIAGGARVPVAFTLNSDNKTRSLGTAMTNASGVARKTFVPTYGGKLTATFEGSTSLLPSSTTKKFTVTSKTSVRLVGPHKTRHGIAFYSSYRKIGILFTTSPPEPTRPTKTDIEAFRHGAWHIAAKLTGSENKHGLLVYFSGPPPSHLKFKVRLIVPSDSLTRGSSATSKVFELT